MFGASELFADFRCDDDLVDYVCFTDDPTLKSDFWQIRLFQEPMTDSHRLSKRFKHLPHVFLSEYDFSIYVDNTVLLKESPSAMFARFSHEPLTMLRHSWRDCIYDEANEVLAVGFDKYELIQPQMEFYHSLNYPKNQGLNATSFIYRRHDDEIIQHIMLDWHMQILCGSKRDQLSWNFCAWRHNFSFCSLNENMMENSLYAWPIVRGDVRLPRIFEENLYKEAHCLHGTTSLDLRKHYLQSNKKDDNKLYRSMADGSKTVMDGSFGAGFYVPPNREIMS